jgi:hypothetical protein
MDSQTWGVVAVKDLYRTRQYIAAPTANEIMEKLPVTIDLPPKINDSCSLPAVLEIEKTQNDERHISEYKWIIRYRCEGDGFRNIGLGGETLVEVLGSMYLYLLEQRLLKVTSKKG